MNVLEKFVYDAVKNNPNLKGRIRNAYQSVFDLLPRKKDFSINPIEAKEGYFFGFHDITPFSQDSAKVLANKLTIPFRMPKNGDVLEVGYFPYQDTCGTYVKLGESKAWNYHKGCRLQWNGENQVIFNDAVDHKVVSQMINLTTGTKKTIAHAIDAATADGKYASSFSYERLERLMPGYGYGYTDEAYLDQAAPAQTGLFLVDLSTGTKSLLVSLKELHGMPHVPEEVKQQKHFVTHTLFSPDGAYLAFLHRSVDESNVSKRWSSIGTVCLKTGKCTMAPTDQMVSHYVWNGKNQIIAYCRIAGVDSHVLFKEPTLQEFERSAYPRLNSDGHQSFIGDDAYITDTYPDKHRMAYLYKVDLLTNGITKLAGLNSFKKYQSRLYKHWACDLHPRMNHQGTVACFDSVHTGKRALCFMNIG